MLLLKIFVAFSQHITSITLTAASCGLRYLQLMILKRFTVPLRVTKAQGKWQLSVLSLKVLGYNIDQNTKSSALNVFILLYALDIIYFRYKV